MTLEEKIMLRIYIADAPHGTFVKISRGLPGGISFGGMPTPKTPEWLDQSNISMATDGYYYGMTKDVTSTAVTS
ncbi:hypothetical protein ACFSVK_06160 [Azorhizophilus paspali]|uniref:hypothetical protein n=1 Tax=Azorhizophilus paspali TaxID=69963 RepID=UPI0036404703